MTCSVFWKNIVIGYDDVYITCIYIPTCIHTLYICIIWAYIHVHIGVHIIHTAISWGSEDLDKAVSTRRLSGRRRVRRRSRLYIQGISYGPLVWAPVLKVVYTAILLGLLRIANY